MIEIPSTLDMNRGINNIQYDKLGNPKKMIFSGGEHLRTIHRYLQNPNVSSSSYQSDTTDYICGLILKNRQPVSYQFAGGYISFSAANTISGIHYYVQDYQGNNRMVINRNATSAMQNIRNDVIPQTLITKIKKKDESYREVSRKLQKKRERVCRKKESQERIMRQSTNLRYRILPPPQK